MSFAQSKFQSQYGSAQNALRRFGVSGIKMVRDEGTSQNASDVPDLTDLSSQRAEEPYNFYGLVVPLTASPGGGSEETLEELFGKTRALLTLEGVPDPEPAATYEYVRLGDIFVLNGKEFVISEMKQINPDNQFPIIYDCLVSGA